jgi:hypothetical protein
MFEKTFSVKKYDYLFKGVLRAVLVVFESISSMENTEVVDVLNITLLKIQPERKLFAQEM